MRRERVVVIGAGFGGLNVVRALDGADVDVTVLDRTNHHLFQPLLYQVATGILPPGLIAPALRSVIKKQDNARALLAATSAAQTSAGPACAAAVCAEPSCAALSGADPTGADVTGTNLDAKQLASARNVEVAEAAETSHSQ